MAGICSKHHPKRGPVEGCAACHATPHDLFPDWDDKVAEAEAAGRHTCTGQHRDPVTGKVGPCEFIYYKTVDRCPLCGTPRKTP